MGGRRITPYPCVFSNPSSTRREGPGDPLLVLLVFPKQTPAGWEGSPRANHQPHRSGAGRSEALLGPPPLHPTPHPSSSREAVGSFLLCCQHNSIRCCGTSGLAAVATRAHHRRERTSGSRMSKIIALHPCLFPPRSCCSAAPGTTQRGRECWAAQTPCDARCVGPPPAKRAMRIRQREERAREEGIHMSGTAGGTLEQRR